MHNSSLSSAALATLASTALSSYATALRQDANGQTSASDQTSQSAAPAQAPTTQSPATQTPAVINSPANSAALKAAAIILNSLPNSVSVASELNTDAMDLSLNRLLQTLQPASLLSKLPQVLLDTRVVQARVLQNTLLQDLAGAAAKNNLAATILTGTNTTQTTAQYRITLAITLNNRQQTIDIVMPTPLPQGKWVQLELRPDNTALLRSAMLPPANDLTAKEQQLQAGVKRALPLQQAPDQVIKRLMELAAQPTFSKLPPAIQQAVNTLRQQWPTPQQAVEPAALQKALNNSGSFYEAKLQQAANQTANSQTTNSQTTNSQTANTAALNQNGKTTTATTALPSSADKPIANANNTSAQNQTVQTPKVDALIKKLHQPAPLASDQKAITLELLTLIGQLVKKPVTSNSENSELITAAELIYKKPQLQATPSALLNSESSDDTGLMLKELGRLLLSTLARTQIHQLDSLQARQSSDNPQAPTATWVLELPIQHGQRTDTLGVHIEQYASKKNPDPRTMQWVVNLTLDLEKLGQLQAQLKVRNQHVKATLWTEQHNTHRLVRKHLHELRQNFERIGVSVDEIDVYQGLPDHVPAHSLQRQLIDVHT